MREHDEVMSMINTRAQKRRVGKQDDGRESAGDREGSRRGEIKPTTPRPRDNLRGNESEWKGPEREDRLIPTQTASPLPINEKK